MPNPYPQYPTDDLRIREVREVIPPVVVHEEFPITEQAARLVFTTRQRIAEIIHGRDDRLLVIVGPCSIHDPEAALDYASRLARVRKELAADLEIVMRVYFEKPRTTIGWKGLVNDPDLDGSFDINKGLRIARQTLLAINNLGVPAAHEFLDLITPQYFADLVSWGAIGARTTESQGHRELASGLSCPVGFKNGTDGDVQIAVDAIRAASHPHVFLSLTKAGHVAIFSTSGNQDCHLILRGGRRPNYDAESVAAAAQLLTAAGIQTGIMIDCSHGNSRKQHERQIEVGYDVAGQVAAGNRRIMGLMVESNIHPGRQDIVPGKPLAYGVSVTDACIGWEDTEDLLRIFAEAARKRRAHAAQASGATEA